MATDLAIFLATSGHSGVDRLARNLAPALARRGYRIDLLKVRHHGPHLDPIPEDKDRVNHTALLARAMAGSSTYLTLSMGTTVSIDLAHRGFFHRLKTRLSMGWFYRLADNVIVTSEGVADDMTAFTGLPRHLINVAPCPIVPAQVFEGDFPKPNHPWFSDGGLPIVMGLGELGSRKDFVTLIRGFARMRSEFPCRLMILGRGRDRERLLATAHELGVSDAIELPGFVDAPYAWLAQASLFAFTSLWEGLGFALIEALAVGVPSVSTDCPSGPREILGNGRYGPLVPVGDHEALAAAMLATLRKRPGPTKSSMPPRATRTP